MLRFVFPAAARDRYGLPEVCEYDLNRPLLSEVRELRRQVGFTIKELTAKVKTSDWESLGILFWLVVLRNASKPPTWDEFDVDLDAVDLEPADQGNSPAPSDGASNS